MVKLIAKLTFENYVYGEWVPVKPEVIEEAGWEGIKSAVETCRSIGIAFRLTYSYEPEDNDDED